jgi:biopolymer transport protein ExbB
MRTIAYGLLLLLVGICFVAPLAAQDAAEPAAPALASDSSDATASDDTALKTLGQEVFRMPRNANDWIGLGFYVVLFIFSMIAATVGLERIFNLRREKVMPAALVRQLRELTRTGRDTRENLEAAVTGTKAPLANVLRDALLRSGRPLAEVEKGIEDGMAREILVLRGKQRALSVMANVGPLVGLFGTVVGMIFAFQVASQAGLGKAELLAKGIYLALLTTAIGLTIAVPCMLVLAYLNAKIDRFMIEMDGLLLQTLPSFASMEQSATKATVVSSDNNDSRHEVARRGEERAVLTAK